MCTPGLRLSPRSIAKIFDCSIPYSSGSSSSLSKAQLPSLLFQDVFIVSKNSSCTVSVVEQISNDSLSYFLLHPSSTFIVSSQICRVILGKSSKSHRNSEASNAETHRFYYKSFIIQILCLFGFRTNFEYALSAD